MDFLNDIKISRKLPVIIVLCAIISAVIIGTISYIEASKALIHSDEAKLSAIRETRKTQLSDYLGSVEEDLISVASNPYTLEALNAYEDGWKALGFDGGQTQTLQKLYITENPNKSGKREKLDYASDGSLYSQAHAKYHPWFRSFIYSRGYYDIFILDQKGNLVYSVYKEQDFATNLNTGKWKDTDLAHAFRDARDSKKIGNKSFYDFRPYAPSNDTPASFVSTPIVDEDNRLAGVLVFQMPIGRINGIMQQADGMGETGETYIVGSDYLMRSDSRFSNESTILKTRVDGVAMDAALNGKSGVEVITDYRGIEVISAYTPFEFLGEEWVILAEIDEAEMLAPVVKMRNNAALMVLVLAAVIVGIGIYFSRLITRPISTITGAMEVLSKGDTSIDVPEIGRKDEIGDMAQALEVFKQNRIEADRLQEEQEQEQKLQLERAEQIEVMTNEFELNVSELVEGLSSASTELSSTAQTMSAIAEQTTAQSSAMTDASQSTAQNIQTVASASEEMSVSIRELSDQVGRTSTASNTAASDVDRASTQIEQLLASSEKIGNVVGLIRDIAEQTNLLALNATIESARAGDAGKGFAVVANEVKTLASETSKATGEIEGQVNTVQNEIRSAVDAIKSIEVTINDVSTASTAIAAAIEEQNTTTDEITRNTQISATNMEDLNTNAQGVNEAAQTTGSSAAEVLSASEEVSRQTDVLKQSVGDFIAKVKSV